MPKEKQKNSVDSQNTDLQAYKEKYPKKKDKDLMDGLESKSLANPLVFKVLMDELRLQRKNTVKEHLTRINEREQKSNLEVAQLISEVKEMIVSEKFGFVLGHIAAKCQEKVYEVKKPKGVASYGYNFPKIVDVISDSEFVEIKRLNQEFDPVELKLAKNMVSFAYLRIFSKEYYPEMKIQDIGIKLLRFFGEEFVRLSGPYVEACHFCEDLHKEGLEIAYMINPSEELKGLITNFETNCRFKIVSDEEMQKKARTMKNGFRIRNENDRKDFLTLGRKVLSRQEFLIKIKDEIEKLTKLCEDQALAKKELEINSQIGAIENLNYFELQAYKEMMNENQPKLVSTINKKLVELTNDAITDSAHFVEFNPKLKSLYLDCYKNKDFQDLFKALKSKFNIDFLNEDGVNPNGVKLLQKLSKLEYLDSYAGKEVQPEVVFVPSAIQRKIDLLEKDSKRVQAFGDVSAILGLIKKYGSVTKFVTQTVKGDALKYGYHKGSSHLGLGLEGCALFRIGTIGDRIAINQDTNEVVYVGNYHKE